MSNYIDEESKLAFRDEKCNIVRMTKSKVPLIPKGSSVLTTLQSQEEFDKLLDADKWGITQTVESNIIFVDLDVPDYNKKLDIFFTRRRDKYVEHSKQINSKHGFLKVTDADNSWCNEFAKKYHLRSGIEVYSKGHWGIVAGTFYNDKNLDDPKRETTWYPLDDFHKNSILKVTKQDLGEVFSEFDGLPTILNKSDLAVDQIIDDNFIIKENEDRERILIKYITSRVQKNPEFRNDHDMLMGMAVRYNDTHVKPPLSKQRLEKVVKQGRMYGIKNLEYMGKINVAKSVPFDVTDEHALIVNDCFTAIGELTKKELSINKTTLYPIIMELMTNEKMKNDYQEGGIKHDQLMQLLELFSDHAENQMEFLQAYLESKTYNRFAHINNSDVSSQFNTWYWTGKQWSDNAAHYVLEKLLLLKGTEIDPSSKMAISICNNISASERTLKISLDSKEYMNQMMPIMTNNQGQYYDFKTGKIRLVDPSFMFFKEPQLGVYFDDTVGDPELFFEFIKERFPDENDAKILLDHMAGALLHTSILGSKPKMLYICGDFDAYKSMIILIFKKIISMLSVSEVSISDLADKWGKSLVMDKIFNYSEEENPIEPKDPANLKNLITSEGGYCHVKYAKKLVPVLRFPRHIIACNKVAPIPKDDNINSIYIRNQYIEIEKVEPPAKDWRKVLLKNDDEIQRIAMYLLKRASEIYNGDKIYTQSLEDCKAKHIKLTRGTLDDFLDKYCITLGVTNDKGTSFNWLLAEYNRVMPDPISNGMLTSQLVEIGFEKKVRNHMYRINDGDPNVFTELSSLDNKDMKTQQTAVMGLVPKVRSKSAVPRVKAKPIQSKGLKSADNS